MILRHPTAMVLPPEDSFGPSLHRPLLPQASRYAFRPLEFLSNLQPVALLKYSSDRKKDSTGRWAPNPSSTSHHQPLAPLPTFPPEDTADEDRSHYNIPLCAPVSDQLLLMTTSASSAHHPSSSTRTCPPTHHLPLPVVRTIASRPN